MSPDNEQHLRAYHPRLFAKSGVEAALVRFAVGDGWLAILDDMAAEIEQTCAGTGSKLPTVLQMKEKFGLLRVYVSDASEAVEAIVSCAEKRSAVTCEDCGEPGSLRRTGGWARTRCDDHVSHRCG